MLPRVLELLRVDREARYWSADETALERQAAMLGRYFDQVVALFRGSEKHA